MKPQLVKEIIDNKGRIVSKSEPAIVRQVISKDTAEQMRNMLEKAVSNGVYSKAYVDGYKIAGISGISDNHDNGNGYTASLSGISIDRNCYTANFVGFAPADNPKFACIVVLQDPYGPFEQSPAARIAGNLFKDIINTTSK